MKEYIERDKAVGIAHGYCHTKDGRCCGPDDVAELYEELKAIPAADVVEVRHAHWVECGDNQPVSSDKVYCCSNCKGNKRLKHQFKPFCELCGAKMLY